MKTLALAMAAAATLAFTVPGFAASAAPDRIRLAQADVNVRVGDRDHDRGERRAHREHRMHRDVRMHRDFDRHEGRRHGHHGNRVVIIKKHHGGKTVIKKKVEG